MKSKLILLSLSMLFLFVSCDQNIETALVIDIFETSAAGNQWASIKPTPQAKPDLSIEINPTITYQTITGFGGAFTEASAYLLNQLGSENRQKVLRKSIPYMLSIMMMSY